MGNVAVMSRSDDVINVAGHRLSTGQLEEVRNREYGPWSVNSRGEYCGPHTLSSVFLIFTTQLKSLPMRLECTVVKELIRREYCYMNTPSLQYFMLLTSGG